MQSIGRVSELVMELDSSILKLPVVKAAWVRVPARPDFFLFFIFF